ncbi:unnamed protein product [Pieris macdunnoughi]|uniref:Uncharacterized protein n=1 Tax=Pieris macdunnoughi TaxID=345717 RepID=A0A821PLI5_9NEOP|nr:unnamed protein product [Pieris macdunnoughi]
MRLMFFAVASLALLAACVCAPNDAIQHIPKQEATQSATEKDGAASGVSANNAGSSEPEREKRDLGGQESDLLPSDHEVSAFGDNSLIGRGRIKVKTIHAGISPVHDFRNQLTSQVGDKLLPMTSPYNVLKHLDNSVIKATKNVTHNPKMEETLYQLSKDLVSAILSKLEIQDKLTRITREALDAPGKTKGMTAIETRRILDYISRTLSGHILTITRASTEPELHRLVYGLAQIAAEISIVSALRDITYATALSKKQSVDLSLRKKRSILPNNAIVVASTPQSSQSTVYDIILNRPITISSTEAPSRLLNITRYSVNLSKKSVNIIQSKKRALPSPPERISKSDSPGCSSE